MTPPSPRDADAATDRASLPEGEGEAVGDDAASANGANGGSAELAAEAGGERAPGLLALAGRMMGVSGPVALPWRWPTAVQALSHRDYRTIWAGAFVSNIGTWMQTVVKGPLILALSKDAASGVMWLGIDAFASGFSALLLPLAGVVADRVDRRWLLVSTNAAQALIALTLAFLYAGGQLTVWHLALSSALMGMAQMLAVPAYQSLMPELVGLKDVPNAVALNALQFNTSRVVGPAIGGLVLARGASWNFGLNALSFLAVIAALALMRSPPRARPAHESVLGSMGAGLGYLRTRADIRVMLALTLLGALLASPLMTLLPALVKQTFAGSDLDYSHTLSAFGLGAVLGAVLLALRSKRGPRPWRAFGMLMALGACLAAVGLVPDGYLFVAQLLVLACGALFVGIFARLNTALMSSTPGAMRGRVSSFFVLAFAGGAPIGGLSGAALASLLGVRGVFGLFGILLALATLAVMLAVRSLGVRYQPDAAEAA